MLSVNLSIISPMHRFGQNMCINYNKECINCVYQVANVSCKSSLTKRLGISTWLSTIGALFINTLVHSLKCKLTPLNNFFAQFPQGLLLTSLNKFKEI